MRLGHLADVTACKVGCHYAFPIAVDEPDWDIQRHQTRQRLARHWPREHVATNDDQVDARVAHFSERGLEREEISVESGRSSRGSYRAWRPQREPTMCT